MANPAKEMAEAVLAESGRSASQLGLRFDRVVVRVLGDLETFADETVPDGSAIVVTITAPICLPAKTVDALRERIAALLASGDPAEDKTATVHGNQVSLRLVRRPADRRPKLVSFVHNPSTHGGELLGLAERWLRY